MTAIYLQRMRHAPIFQNITDEAWAAIEPLMQYRSYNAGEFLLRGGEPAIHSFWLMSGVCREYFITLEGTQHNKSFVFAGDIAGSLYDLNSGEPSTVSIEFLESSDGFLMDFRKFTTLRSQFPCWNVWHLQMAEALFMKKARREYELLTLNATQRYQQFLRQYPGVDLQVPLYHVASYLGMTPEALSRVRKKLSLI